MNKKLFGFVFLLNYAIALGFYLGGRNANATDISSDLGNIIPICMKLDHPDLFKKDLYLSDIGDVEYYTPFYVQSLRSLSKITNSGYIEALNILSFITHLSYGLLWFLLFYTLKKDYWLAIISSLLIRGVVWPPGGELLGISELWTIMPRTVFFALIPLPFISFVYLKKYKILLSGFLLGFILNFHPLSGIGIIVAYFSIFILCNYYHKTLKTKVFVQDLIVLMLSCLLGLFPFLLTYFTTVKTNLSIDPNIYALAFNSRIGSIFTNPVEFIRRWNRPPLIFFGAVFLIYYFFDTSFKKINFKILFFAMLVVFVSANSFAYLESFINVAFHKNIRMAFQLIRYQKFILIFFQIGFYLLLVELFNKYCVSSLFKRKIFVAYTIVLIVSTLPFFKNVPFIGDDICTAVLPNSFHFYREKEDEEKRDLGLMLEYINKNTEKDAVFYGSPLIRTAANRSVVLDGKGASMLIEGNQQKFIEWYKDLKQMNSFKCINDKTNFLKKKEVSYILNDTVWENAKLVKQFGKMQLYKI